MALLRALAVIFAAIGVGISPAGAVGWLSTSGNRIVDANGTTWVGHGANMHDTRSCGAFTADDGTPLHDDATGVSEVERRIDVLVDQWKANFIRLVLESRRPQDSYSSDATYRARLKEIVDYIGTKPNVYVLMSLWIDPTFDANGWPTTSTDTTLDRIARDFYSYPYVLYGVSNEPESNFDGALDSQVWTRMSLAVKAIRDAETAVGGANPNRHVITVQGTRDWARDLSYYVANPITAGGAVVPNVAYETHIYNSPNEFATLLAPASTLPVIVGEFGPVDDGFHASTVADMQTLIDLAKSKNVPHLAWTFHQYCPPNLIADVPGKAWNFDSTDTDGIAMPIYPTDFGQLLIDNWKVAAATTLDVDGNAHYDALGDGLIVVRYLFGLTGTPLTAGALGAGATITDPAQIRTNLDGMRAALDVDANGQVDALTDGLLILRYLFGLRGTALIQGALGPGAVNDNATAVEAAIKVLLP